MFCFSFKSLSSRAGGVAQAVEHLPIKHEAQSSNPSIAKNKAKQDK
jgi:hypothetical protein